MWLIQPIEFNIHPNSISIEIPDKIGSGGRPWFGEYEAYPLFEEQLFATRDRMMLDDFIVHQIEYLKQANESGKEISIAANASKSETDMINKVTCGGSTLVDLSQDTAQQDSVAKGKYVHLANGQRVEGLAYSKVDNGILELTFGEVSEEDESMDVIY